jgi:hypothetical protein
MYKNQINSLNVNNGFSQVLGFAWNSSFLRRQIFLILLKNGKEVALSWYCLDSGFYWNDPASKWKLILVIQSFKHYAVVSSDNWDDFIQLPVIRRIPFLLMFILWCAELGEKCESFLADISTPELYDPNNIACDETLLDQVPIPTAIKITPYRYVVCQQFYLYMQEHTGSVGLRCCEKAVVYRFRFVS